MTAACQEIQSKKYTIEIQVEDDKNMPVKDAIVSGSNEKLVENSPITQAIYQRAEVKTDDSGSANLILTRYSEVPSGLLINKLGYYTTTLKLTWLPNLDGTNSNHAKNTVILKPIKNPIPMLARNDLRIRTPEFNIPYGFDLEMGEPFPPFGNGKMLDLIFTLTGSRSVAADPQKELIDFSLEVRCPNPDDGLVEFLVEDTTEFSKGSQLPSAHEAPANGYFQSIKRIMATDEDGGLAGATNVRNADARKCYYFRVRTKRDANGKIISANYGKIYGPLEIRPALARYGHDSSKGQGGLFIHYLYPKEENRNLAKTPQMK
jgi:hypothetical protein